MQDDLSAALSALDEDFQAIEGYDHVPDGEYWTVVEDVNMDIAPSSGLPRITWKLQVIERDHFGKRLQRVFVITRDSLRWLKRDLYLCGIGLRSLKDLRGSLDNLSNLKLRVSKNSRSVHILSCDAPVSEKGHLFLHLIDQNGSEYLDQQLRPRQYPQNHQEFKDVIDFFVRLVGPLWRNRLQLRSSYDAGHRRIPTRQDVGGGRHRAELSIRADSRLKKRAGMTPTSNPCRGNSPKSAKA